MLPISPERRHHAWKITGHRTIEAAYLDIVRRGIKVPHLFINQLVHVILRNALDGCDDPYVLRAAELFFRPQRMTLHDGSLIAADEETIAGKSDTPVSPLVSMLGIPAEAADRRDDRRQRRALFRAQRPVPCRARSERRPARLAGAGDVRSSAGSDICSRIDVEIEPFTEMREAKFTWYVGLDAEGTRIGDVLWNGEELDEAAQARVVGLFRLTFRDPDVAMDKVKGEPVYLILAMDKDKVLRLKPQNLVTGLPIKHLEAVT